MLPSLLATLAWKDSWQGIPLFELESPGLWLISGIVGERRLLLQDRSPPTTCRGPAGGAGCYLIKYDATFLNMMNIR